MQSISNFPAIYFSKIKKMVINHFFSGIGLPLNFSKRAIERTAFKNQIITFPKHHVKENPKLFIISFGIPRGQQSLMEEKGV